METSGGPSKPQAQLDSSKYPEHKDPEAEILGEHEACPGATATVMVKVWKTSGQCLVPIRLAPFRSQLSPLPAWDSVGLRWLITPTLGAICPLIGNINPERGPEAHPAVGF